MAYKPYTDQEHYMAQAALSNEASTNSNIPYIPQLYEQIQEQRAVLVEQINPRKVAEDIILTLKGYEKDEKGNLIQFGEPMLNEKGLEKIKFLLRSFVNQRATLTHLNEVQIEKIMTQIGDDLTDDLSLNWKQWGIKSKTDLDTIENTVLMNIYYVLNSSLGQNEKNWLGKITMEAVNGSQNKIPNMKKEGILSKIFKL